MNKLLYIAFLLSFNFAICQIVIPFQRKGVIFSQDYKFYMFDSVQRFTPSITEIEICESLLRERIADINKNMPNQQRQPKIHRNLNKYKRQYIGYFDENGKRIIYINFLWKGYTEYDLNGEKIEPWKNEWLQMFDGGSHYWQIKYNADDKTFFEFTVNGVA